MEKVILLHTFANSIHKLNTIKKTIRSADDAFDLALIWFGRVLELYWLVNTVYLRKHTFNNSTLNNITVWSAHAAIHPANTLLFPTYFYL